MSSTVEVIDVVKVFGDIHALDGLSFSVKPTEIFGLIGPMELEKQPPYVLFQLYHCLHLVL